MPQPRKPSTALQRGVEKRRALLTLALAVLAAGACRDDLDTRMNEVRALQDVGQFSKSVDSLRQILAMDPDTPEGNYRLGLALMQTGEPSQAVWSLQKASESSEYAVVASLLLANSQFALKNYEGSVQATNRVLEIDAEHIDALQIRAKALVGAHRLEDALTDARRLVEYQPEDLESRVVLATVLMELDELDESEREHVRVKELGEKSDDPATAARSCIALPLFVMDARDDVARAEQLYEACIEKYPTNTFLIGHVMGFLDRIEKPERSTELIESAVELAPENLSLRSTLAERLASLGAVDEAEQVLIEATETFGSATAWNMLANFYKGQRELEKALEAIDQVIELTGGGEQINFGKADLLVDLARYDEAEQIVSTLSEPTYAALIEGRLRLVRGDPRGALEAFDRGIRHWPNNPGARYLAGLAARELGDYERAISELRESVRADPKATDASYVLANLYYDRGDFENAATLAVTAARQSSGVPNAGIFIVAARAFSELGRYDEARAAIEALRKIPGYEAAAVVELAALEGRSENPAAAVKRIKDSGLDLSQPEHEDALRTLTDQLVKLRRLDEALQHVEAAITKRPDDSTLHSLRGNLLARSQRTAEARTAYERARDLEPLNAEALGGLATLEAHSGNLQGAVELFDRAAGLDSRSATYRYAASQLTLAQGKIELAEARLREIVRDFPREAGPRNDLAWILAQQGRELDYALELAGEAARHQPTPEMLDTLGFVQLKSGDPSSAVTSFEESLRLSADAPSTRYHLATALQRLGQDERAREMLRLALAGENFPEAEEARRQLSRLEKP